MLLGEAEMPRGDWVTAWLLHGYPSQIQKVYAVDQLLSDASLNTSIVGYP